MQPGEMRTKGKLKLDCKRDLFNVNEKGECEIK